MRRRQTASIILILLVGALATPTAALAALKPVRLEAFRSAEAIAPGGTFHVAVRLSMDEGWHVQSNQPSEENFIATVLELEAAKGLEAVRLLYPPGHDLDAPALGGTLSVYNDGAVLGAEIHVAPTPHRASMSSRAWCGIKHATIAPACSRRLRR